MPTTAANFTAAERTLRGRSYPYLIGNNVLERYNQLPQWRTSGTFSFGDDISDPDYPTTRAFDRQSHLVTRPDIAEIAAMNSAGEVSLLLELTPGSTSLYTVDTFIITGHNLHLFQGGADVYVDFDGGSGGVDVSDFSGTVYGALWDTNTTPWDDGRRLISQEVGITGTASRFTAIRYARIRIVPAGDFEDDANNPLVPEIGEVWLGRRRQMSTMPDRPWSNRRGRGVSTLHIGETNIQTAYRQTSKQSLLGMTVRSGGSYEGSLGWSQLNELQKVGFFAVASR